MFLSSAQLLQSPPSFQLYGFPLCSTFTSLALHIGLRTNNLEINFITEPIGNLCFPRWSWYLPLSSYFNTQEIFIKTRRKAIQHYHSFSIEKYMSTYKYEGFLQKNSLCSFCLSFIHFSFLVCQHQLEMLILRTEPAQDSSPCHSRRFLQQTCCSVGTESADLVPMNLWQYITHLESTFKHGQGSPILTTASTVFVVVLYLHLFYKLYNLDMLNAALSLQW